MSGYDVLAVHKTSLPPGRSLLSRALYAVSPAAPYEILLVVDLSVGPTQMNRDEAKAILSERLARYREQSYTDLACLVGSHHVEQVTARSGVAYQVEYDFVWDGKPGFDVRVIGGIDDGGMRAFLPITDSFIKAPNGQFIGE